MDDEIGLVKPHAIDAPDINGPRKREVTFIINFKIELTQGLPDSLGNVVVGPVTRESDFAHTYVVHGYALAAHLTLPINARMRHHASSALTK